MVILILAETGRFVKNVYLKLSVNGRRESVPWTQIARKVIG